MECLGPTHPIVYAHTFASIGWLDLNRMPGHAYVLVSMPPRAWEAGGRRGVGGRWPRLKVFDGNGSRFPIGLFNLLQGHRPLEVVQIGLVEQFKILGLRFQP